MDNPKKNFEEKITEIVSDFEKKTGLKAGWIDVKRNASVGFCALEHKLNCKIKIKDE